MACRRIMAGCLTARQDFLNTKMLPDSYLAEVIDQLGRAPDHQQRDARLFRVDYRDLAIQHLGSVYEGLLELHPRYATVPMVVVRKNTRDNKTELIQPQSQRATWSTMRRASRYAACRDCSATAVEGLALFADGDAVGAALGAVVALECELGFAVALRLLFDLLTCVEGGGVLFAGRSILDQHDHFLDRPALGLALGFADGLLAVAPARWRALNLVTRHAFMPLNAARSRTIRLGQSVFAGAVRQTACPGGRRITARAGPKSS